VVVTVVVLGIWVSGVVGVVMFVVRVMARIGICGLGFLSFRGWGVKWPFVLGGVGIVSGVAG
jgi:hypothetical protein